MVYTLNSMFNSSPEEHDSSLLGFLSAFALKNRGLKF